MRSFTRSCSPARMILRSSLLLLVTAVNSPLFAQTSAATPNRFERFQRAELYHDKSTETTQQLGIEFSGSVVDDDGPVGDAVVLLRQCQLLMSGNAPLQPAPPIVARTTTDAEGNFRFSHVHTAGPSYRGNYRWEALVCDSKERLGFGVFAVGKFTMSPFQGDPFNQKLLPPVRPIKIHLHQQQSYRGTIVGSDDQPLAGVRVVVRDIADPRAIVLPSPSDRNEPKKGDEASQFEIAQHHIAQHHFHFSADPPLLVAVSDEQGQFEFNGPPGGSLLIGLRRESYFPRLIRISSVNARNHSRQAQGPTEFQTPATIKLRRNLAIATRLKAPGGKAPDEFAVYVQTPGKGYTRVRLRRQGLHVVTTAEYLKEHQDDSGKIEFCVEFPFQTGLLPVTITESVDSLLKSREIVVQAEQGARAAGRVIAAGDHKLHGLAVVWHPDRHRIPDQTIQTTTDQEGHWQMAIPTRQGFLSVVGSVTGQDVWTVERFNAARGDDYPFTRSVGGNADQDGKMTLAAIAPRTVSVVDDSGNPIPNADVKVDFLKTVVQDGKTYRLRERLAAFSKTDVKGNATLTLNRSDWSGGEVRVTHFPLDENENPTSNYWSGRAAILPGDRDPIRVIVRPRVEIVGKLLIDGKPASGVELASTVRGDRGRFSRLNSNYEHPSADGEFQVLGEAGLKHSIMVVRGLGQARKRYYYHQEPAQKLGPRRYSVGTISINRDQLLTLPELDEKFR